jgi:hypothetical protein
MIWANAFTAALKRLSPFASLDHIASCQKASAGVCHTAPSTKPTPSPDVTARLERRGLMIHNRNREAAARYVALHQTLIKER